VKGMKSSTAWVNFLIPNSWVHILLDTLKVALVAFVVLQIKEWFDAGAFDTPATVVDAVLIAVGILVLNAILLLAKSR
jgi:hypothetical protein